MITMRLDGRMIAINQGVLEGYSPQDAEFTELAQELMTGFDNNGLYVDNWDLAYAQYLVDLLGGEILRIIPGGIESKEVGVYDTQG